MGFFSRLLGVEEPETRRSARDVVAGTGSSAVPVGMGSSAVPESDVQAVERYRYMLRTAPPETLEQAHAEAFAKLSPEQRRQVLDQLTTHAPEGERAAVAATSIDDPQALGRVATRAEVRSPGTLERTFGGMGGGMGMGASLLSSFAMGFAGSMIAQSFFGAMGGFGGDSGVSEQAAADETSSDESAQADDEAGDDDGAMGGDDFGGGDFDV